MDEMFELILVGQQAKEIAKILACNEKSEKYGLRLREEDVKELMISRKDSLKENQRIEFGEGILPAIIDAFCDSAYINQDNYTSTLSQLQEIFYLYKNEAEDELNDTELLDFMRRQFDTICFGDLEYLRSTCMERFARAVRGGYQCHMQHRLRDEYTLRDVENEYEKWDEETRWEYELYMRRLEDTY